MAKTLLVIDDSATVRQITHWVFHGLDIEVSEAASAQAAREALSANAPDVVLVDYHLPDASGVELCRELRQMSALSGTRIVLLTGDYHPLDEAEAASCGADATLKKPFKTNAILDVIEGGVSEGAAQAPTAAATPPAAAAPAAASGPSREPGDSNLSFDVADDDEGDEAPPPPPSSASGLRTSPPVPGSGLRKTPPTPGSGARKLPPVPGSGLRNLPPVSGSGNYRAVSGATRLPRSGTPTGSHAPVRDSEETVSAAAVKTQQEAATSQYAAAEAKAKQDAPTGQHEAAKATPAATSPSAPAQVGSAPTETPAGRQSPKSAEQITTEISAVDEEENGGAAVSDAQLRRVLNEVLPPMIRRAVVEELQAGLNDKVIAHGRRSVEEWVENKLPRLAEQVIGRKLDE